MTDRVRNAMALLPGAEQLIFTAHSIPVSMAEASPYVRQLKEASAAVAARCGMDTWQLVYQSRSGPPTQPWLSPDICDYLRKQHAAGVRRVILCPIGFLSDHMEVLYDLDTEAPHPAAQLREHFMTGVALNSIQPAGMHRYYRPLHVD